MSSLEATTFFNENTPRIALRSLFTKYDVDQNGLLNRLELYKLLKDDLRMTTDQAETYFHLLDTDADGHVSFSEFQKWFFSGEKFETITNGSRYAVLRKAIDMFKRYDVDHNLAIDKTEFHQLFTEIGGKGSKMEKKAMKELDLDGNGRVSFHEFLSWLNWTQLKDLKI